jgi:hypothetical protein
MANLLAYRGVGLYTSVPTARGLATVGWHRDNDHEMTLTWPLWDGALGLDGVGTAIALPELVSDHPDNAVLRARGIFATYRASRILVGTGASSKVNFAPARPV